MSFVSLHAHSSYSYLDSCLRIKDYVGKVKELGQNACAITDHGNISGALEFYRECKKQDIKPLMGCCLPGQIIYTNRGPIPIEEITENDYVITHKGRFKKVLRTMTRNYNGTIYGIDPWVNEKMWLTDEHPVLITNNKNETKWIRADRIKFGQEKSGGTPKYINNKLWQSYVNVPIKYKFNSKNSFHISEFLNIFDEQYIIQNNKIAKRAWMKNGVSNCKHSASNWINTTFVLDYNFGRLCGLFLAEGSYQSTKNKLNGISFTFNINEDEYVNFVLSEIKRYFGVIGKARKRKNKNTCDVIISSSIIAELFYKLFGKYSHRKIINTKILYINNNKFHRGILDGICEGDAKTTSKFNILKLSNKKLMYTLKHLFAKFGQTINILKLKPNGKNGQKRTAYYAHISHKATKSKYSIIENDYIKCPIKNIETKQYNGPVYNIEVEDDNSYLSGFAIHNCEFYITEDNKKKERKAYHIICLAMDNKGWENIVRLTTYANTPLKKGGGFYYKPRVDLPTLFKYKEGVIVLTACVGGLIPFNMVNNIEKAESLTKKFKKEFGDRFYLEIQQVNRDGIDYIPEQHTVIDISRKFAKKYNIPVVATNDIHYLNKEDHVSHEILKAISSRKTLDDPVRTDTYPQGRAKFNGYDYYVQTEEEMLSRFEKEEVEESQKVADRCNVEIEFIPASKIPCYNGLTDEDAYDLLLKKAREKTVKKKIFTKNDKDYVSRIKKELSDIKEAHLAHYFLIVNDVCEFADSNGIARGPGRGSAGGSLLSYILGITNTDPLKYDLIWERFYNKGRKGSYPDIDLDFDVRKRGQIIEYLRHKFGYQKVHPMMTVGTMAGKAALKDVGRAIGLKFDYINKITKRFPHKVGSIAEAVKTNAEIKEISEGVDSAIKAWKHELEKTTNGLRKKQLNSMINERSRKLEMLFKHAQVLEDCKRQPGGHACAMVVSDKDLNGEVPLLWDARNKRHVTAYDMRILENMGFLKLDVLGIKSVTVIDIIRKELSKDKISHDKKASEAYDDEKVFNMAARGRTKGIFQLESHLGVNWMKKVMPSDLGEWADVIALIRPATLETGLSQEYADNKKAQKIEYAHPDLESIFNKTQGIMLYQEQMIEVCKQIAGFSLEESDKIRKACGKKLPEEMAKYKDKFISGCLNNNYDKELAEKLWALIDAAAGYSFNKCICGNETIKDTNGNIHYIKDLKPNTELMSIDENGCIIPNRLVKLISSGKQQLYEFEFNNGIKIKCTMNHKFLCEDNKYHTMKDILNNDLEVVNVKNSME